jgi:hypothetical protein
LIFNVSWFEEKVASCESSEAIFYLYTFAAGNAGIKKVKK